LVRHFSKNQRSVLKWLLKSLFAPSLISGMKRLLALWRNREALKQVIPTDASLLNDLKPLSELTGAFFIRHPFAKTVSVYEVVNSVIMYPAIAEHVDPELWVQSLKARPWLKALQVKATEIKRISPVLDSVDTPGMHAYFWSMDDLRGYIKAPR
jgi:hypothetical protein